MPAIKTNESSLKSIFDHDFIFSSRKKRVTIDNQIFAIGFFSPALFRIFSVCACSEIKLHSLTLTTVVTCETRNLTLSWIYELAPFYSVRKFQHIDSCLMNKRHQKRERQQQKSQSKIFSRIYSIHTI